MKANRMDRSLASRWGMETAHNEWISAVRTKEQKFLDLAGDGRKTRGCEFAVASRSVYTPAPPTWEGHPRPRVVERPEHLGAGIRSAAGGPGQGLTAPDHVREAS